ncbi:MAG: UDP-N-acetylglucosamine 1-carboxyvinyltransferase [Patescibacteria group bacterium]
MAKFIVTGGNKLEGVVKVSGSKNSALKLIPTSLLADSPVTLTNVPQIRDVDVMLDLVEKLGAKVDRKAGEVTIDSSKLSSYELDSALASKVRASVVFAAPLLVRFGKAIISLPGGDQIGERVLDTHFSMLKEFGVEMTPQNGKFLLEWKVRKSPNIFLEEASVTATEMALIMAAGQNGNIQIEDTASEPHVSDLADFLTKMGATIDGAGSSTISIKGNSKLRGVIHKVIPDHIDGGTFAIAAAITGGKVEIKDFIYDHYKMILNYLGNMGVDYEVKKDSLIIKSSNLVVTKRKFQTRPYPGFPTDLMSPFIVLATQTEGTVLCHDWMYEWRVFFVDDLIGMGANIFIADPHRVIVTGPTKLRGDKLFCKDIRAGVSILLAALVAQGESQIENIEMIERGYEKIEERFTSLGANIKRQ